MVRSAPLLLITVAYATQASAGSPAPFPIERAPGVILTTPSPSFAGGYIGGSLGGGNLDFGNVGDVIDEALDGDIDGDGDDDGDDNMLLDAVVNLLDIDDTALAYGLHAGYHIQRGNAVFGPEISVFGGEAAFSADVPTFGDVSVEVERGVRLGLRGGIVRGANLFYGLVGMSYLDFSASGLGPVDPDGDIGYALGFGYERLVTSSAALGVQYTLHQVDDFDFGVGDSGLDIEYRSLDLRISFQF